jgi:hypothetical protein
MKDMEDASATGGQRDNLVFPGQATEEKVGI